MVLNLSDMLSFEIKYMPICFLVVSQLMLLKIYLFGSFANGTYIEDSDFYNVSSVENLEILSRKIHFRSFFGRIFPQKWTKKRL